MNSKTNFLFYCLQCNEPFTTKDELYEHYQEHKMHYIFQYVFAEPGKEPVLHEIENSYKCSKCDEGPRALEYMMKHFKLTHPNTSLKICKIYAKYPSSSSNCSHCHKEFEYKLLLDMHVENLHKGKEIAKDDHPEQKTSSSNFKLPSKCLESKEPKQKSENVAKDDHTQRKTILSNFKLPSKCLEAKDPKQKSENIAKDDHPERKMISPNFKLPSKCLEAKDPKQKSENVAKEITVMKEYKLGSSVIRIPEHLQISLTMTPEMDELYKRLKKKRRQLIKGDVGIRVPFL